MAWASPRMIASPHSGTIREVARDPRRFRQVEQKVFAHSILYRLISLHPRILCVRAIIGGGRGIPLRRLACSSRAPQRCCLGLLLARRLLVQEILVFDWIFAPIEFFARVYLFLPVSLHGGASSRALRGLHGLRGVFSVGPVVARLMPASSRVLAWLFVPIDSPVTWQRASSHV